jgi:hypothetical protein
MNFEKYVGIPYLKKGRDIEGLDCYGLVRLIYKNELNIDLPSFTSDYSAGDNERIEELIAQYKEGWEEVQEPVVGDIIVFKVMGQEAHVGLIVSPGYFIHCRENQDSAIESLNSHKWNRRITGFFRYSEKNNALLNTVPHPLKTERYTVPVIPGTTVTELVENISSKYNVACELKSRISILINTRLINQEDWSSTIINTGDVIEYRAVPTGSTGRLLAVLAIAYFAPILANQAAGAFFTAAGGVGGGVTAFSVGAVYTAAYAATILVGTALVNAIAPIRPPTDASANQKDPGSAERQLMVNGGSNRANPYGSIPVVLGKVRMTPLLGANNYLTYENERDSFVSMLLIWGYGPLDIDTSTYRIGEIPLTSYTDYEKVDLHRKTEPTSTELNAFNAIYGNDVTPVTVSTELACEGNPETSVTPGPFLQAATSDVVDSATVALHFPQGLRKIKTKGDGAGESYATAVSFRVEYSVDNGANWLLQEVLSIGGDAPKKDGFTFTRTYKFPSRPSSMIMKVRRETGDNAEDSPNYRYYFTSVLQSVTFTRNARPAVDPLNSKIAKTAFKIKATDQLNGRVEGLSAVVQTWCKKWNGSAWVDGATSNPAALFRYVLEHPANPRKITDASLQINLTQLQEFYNYCESKGFEYNSVLGEARSILEVLRDICAAGRASPALIDGKWTVIIDKARDNVVQHFSPHNSWGFEGTKSLPKKPDGLRITYFDQDKNYQESEIIVYDIDKDENNSSLFESISLPGVTKKSLVIDHAKWHMAQIKLRPEVYTLNVDIEYLVCNRGDWVKVSHDVPMWGIGSGRIKQRVSSTKLILDEEMPMQANLAYTIRFRNKLGGSVAVNAVPKVSDGYYSEIDLLTSVTTDDADVGDLFLFGELNNESQDLVVLSVEPSTNKSARLVLVDYAITDEYNIFTDYISLSSSTVFESQITLPAVLQVENFKTNTPNITGFVSDESVMERVSKGVYRYNINMSYVNAQSLPLITESVEVQYDLFSATTSVNTKSIFVPYQKGSAQIADVKEGETYKIRARYIGRNGKVGIWSSYSNHTVIGKSNPPSDVTVFTASSDRSSGQLLLSWQSNPELDVYTYEVRTQNANWGSNDAFRIFYGDANRCFTKFITNGSASFYIKAIDSAGNFSTNSTQVSYSSQTVPNITEIRHSFADTALTSATVTLEWDEVTSSEFGIDYYEVSYDSVLVTVKGNTITLPADWLGERIFTIKTVNIHGKKSSGYSDDVFKAVPNPPTNVKTQVVDNTVMLYWNLPIRTSLPIDHILIKKGSSWETAEPLGDKKGEFTTVNESTGGNFTYWLVAVDTEGVESAPVSVTTLVAEPPDFVFHEQFVSSFSGTKSSAAFDGTVLALPVNTTETFQQHFASRLWNSPQDQINAGYPIFIQPTGGAGYYEEVFDFGQPLASSRVLLNFTGRVLAGVPIVTPKISLSLDNSTYVDYDGVTDVFGLNFRYVKIRISVDEVSEVGVYIALYEISQLTVRLDAKLKNDAGNVDALSTDTLGTIVNFNKEFIDVQSITVSPSATTAVIPVYDIKDEFVSGAYTVSSSTSICTVIIFDHGLITGQKVKLFINSGSGVPGIYTILSHGTNTFTVSMATPTNASGSCSMYPQSFRVYLFNNSGTRVSANTSWSIKGY